MIASLLFLHAAGFYLVAGLGLLRLPDALTRLHAGSGRGGIRAFASRPSTLCTGVRPAS